MNNNNSKNLLYFLILFGLCCNTSITEDLCLQSLDLISQNDKIYKVQGELRTFSKGLYTLENGLEQTLGLPEDTFVGCLVFEENFPDCFGCYLLDSRLSIDYSSIKLHSKVQVELEKIKLTVPIKETIMNKKDIQYLYIVKSVVVMK